MKSILATLALLATASALSPADLRERSNHLESRAAMKDVQTYPRNHPMNCLTVQDGAFGYGQPVVIAPCDGSNSQKMTFQKSTGLVMFKDNGREWCLDANSSPREGSQLKLWECLKGKKSVTQQKWILADDGTIKLADAWYNLCVDLPGDSVHKGNRLQVWSCYAGNTNQQWLTKKQQAPAQ